MPAINRQQGGRIGTHGRDTGDNVVLLSTDVVIDDAHKEMIRSTEKLEINVKLQNEYRNQLALE